MRIAKQRMICLECNHVFEGELVMNAPIAVACASMKAIRCPKCSSDQVALGGAYKDVAPAKAPIEERANWWLARGDTGTSSKTLYAVFCGLTLGDREQGIPHDPADFARGHKLFELIPEWRKQLSRVEKVIPWWKPFLDRWAEMEQLYAEESPAGSCPKLYQLMKLAEVESLRIRYPKAIIKTHADGSVRSMNL